MLGPEGIVAGGCVRGSRSVCNCLNNASLLGSFKLAARMPGIVAIVSGGRSAHKEGIRINGRDVCLYGPPAGVAGSGFGALRFYRLVELVSLSGLSDVRVGGLRGCVGRGGVSLSSVDGCYSMFPSSISEGVLKNPLVRGLTR